MDRGKEGQAWPRLISSPGILALLIICAVLLGIICIGGCVCAYYVFGSGKMIRLEQWKKKTAEEVSTRAKVASRSRSSLRDKK